MISAIGVTLGTLIHTLFAAFGLAIILKTFVMAFLVVEFAAAGYLIYLGIKSVPIQPIAKSHNQRRTQNLDQ